MAKKKKPEPKAEPQFDCDYVVYKKLGLVWGPRRMDADFFQYSRPGARILAQGPKDAMEAAYRLLRDAQ